MFVSWKVISRKSFFKLFCVCLLLEKLVNEKHFQSKKNLAWFSGKYFPFSCVCFPESGFREITFQTFLCLFASRKVGQWKTLSSKRKIRLGFQESVFLKNLGGKHFPKDMKNLEISLFADYIKFDPQTFDCYIYILFWIFIF